VALGVENADGEFETEHVLCRRCHPHRPHPTSRAIPAAGDPFTAVS
jgi:hypothetical protein